MPKSADEELLTRAYALEGDAETKALYRDWAGTYDRTMVQGLGYLTPEATANDLASHLSNGEGPVLDIGAGTGLAGRALSQRGFETIHALDYSAEMLAQADQTGVYQLLIEADLNKPLPINDETYAGMICTGTFTHAHVGSDCLHELFRALAPDGVFAFTVHGDLWETAGFSRIISDAANVGIVSVIDRYSAPFFADSDGDDGWFVTLKKAAR